LLQEGNGIYLGEAGTTWLCADNVTLPPYIIT